MLDKASPRSGDSTESLFIEHKDTKAQRIFPLREIINFVSLCLCVPYTIQTGGYRSIPSAAVVKYCLTTEISFNSLSFSMLAIW